MLNIPRPETSLRLGWIGIAFFLVVTLSLASEELALGWDESVYLGMGRYFWSGGSEGLFEDIRPPVWPLISGLIGNDLSDTRYLMVLFGLLTLFGIWYLGVLLGNERSEMGVLVLASTPLFLVYSTHRLSGIAAACFVVWSLCALYKKHYLWAGILSGLAFFTRYPAGLILLTIPLLLYWDKKPYKEFLQGVALVILPFLILGIKFGYILGMFKALFHAGNVLLNDHSWLFYYEVLWEQPLLFFGIIGCIYGLWEKKYRQIALPLLLWTVFFSFISNQQERFALLFIPLLAVMGAVILGKHENSWLIVILGLVFVLPAAANLEHETLYPEVQQELYKKLPGGVVLTSMPFPGAVSEGLYIPMYDDPPTALQIYQTTESDYVLYSPDYYPIVDGMGYGLLEEEVFRNKMLWNISLGGYDYYFFERA